MDNVGDYMYAGFCTPQNTLKKIPDIEKTPEMCREAVRKNPYEIRFVPERLITAEMCSTAIQLEPFTYWYIPKTLRTPAMYAEVSQRYVGPHHDFLPDGCVRPARVIVQPTNGPEWKPFGMI